MYVHIKTMDLNPVNHIACLIFPHADDKIHIDLTLCWSNLKPYCMGRKAAFFFSGHLNLHTAPETGLPSREKKS